MDVCDEQQIRFDPITGEKLRRAGNNVYIADSGQKTIKLTETSVSRRSGKYVVEYERHTK